MTPAAPSYRKLFWVLVLLGFALDIGTKYGVSAWLGENGKHDVIPHYFSLLSQTEHNQGALFGIFKSFGDHANLGFTIVSALVIAFILVWALSSSTKSDRILNIALGLVLGGALGNLYDRLVFDGVRDWIWVYWWSAEEEKLRFNWPVFNVADMLLVCGATLLGLQAVFGKQPGAATSKPEPAAQPPELPSA